MRVLDLKGLVFSLALLMVSGQAALLADPLLTKPEIIAGKIIIYPDHRTPKLFYYVPTGLVLSQTYGQPRFFFYKYVYVKEDAPEGPKTTAGGVLTLSVEFGDETETLKAIKGTGFEYRPVPIETIDIVLSYSGIEGEEAGAEEKELASNKVLWTGKNFTLPLSRESASYLWKIFEDKKAAGLSVECSFSYGGYELDEEGKPQPGERSGRLSLAVPVSMENNPDLFKVINLAEKFSFNFRRMSVLCFDFVNGTSNNLVKLAVEIEIKTARGQRDFKIVTFASGTEPQQNLEFNIPEAKGGKYRWRATRVYADGRSERSSWQEGDNAFLDLSTYELNIREN
jgi:hypothetical protein